MTKKDSASSGGKSSPPKKQGRLRRAFFAGLATLLPTVLTLLIISFAWNFLSEKIATPITGLIESGLKTSFAKKYYWQGVWNLPEEFLNDTINNKGVNEGLTDRTSETGSSQGNEPSNEEGDSSENQADPSTTTEGDTPTNGESERQPTDAGEPVPGESADPAPEGTARPVGTDNPIPREIYPKGDIKFEDRVKNHVPNWVGFVLALVLVFLVGFIFKGYLGRQAIRLIESWILRVPLIKVIYPYAKQVTEFFFKEKKAIQYESCVAVEYPRKGIYSVGFVTSEGFRQVSELAGSPVVSIFIPSSPTPVTGYTILVPRQSVTPLDMTVDEALRFTISGGVILPPKQVPPLALKTRKIEPAESASGESGGGEASKDGEEPSSSS